MVFSGVLCALVAATDFLYIPEYWNPPFFFDLIHHIGVSLEDPFDWFFVGGVIAALYEYLLGKRLRRVKNRDHIHLGTIAIFVLFYFGLEMPFPHYTILNLAVACAAAALFGVIQRRDLCRQVFSSGLLFMALYVVLFQIFLALFPEFINRYYNHQYLIGIFILHLPIEEFLISFSGGMLWSILYEYTLGYKTVNTR